MTLGLSMNGLRTFQAIKNPDNVSFGQRQAFNRSALTAKQSLMFDLLKDKSIAPSEKTAEERRHPKAFLEKCLDSPELPNQSFETYFATLPPKKALAFLDNLAENPSLKNSLRDKSNAKPTMLKSLDTVRAALTGKTREFQSESLAVSIAKQFRQDMFQPHRESILTDFVPPDRREAAKEAFKFLDYGLETYEQNGAETGVRRNVVLLFDEIASTDKGKAYLESLRDSLDDKMFQEKILFEARDLVAHPKNEKGTLEENMQDLFKVGKSSEMLAQELANRGITFTMPPDTYFEIPEKTSAERAFTVEEVDSPELTYLYRNLQLFPMDKTSIENPPETLGAFMSSLSLKEGNLLLAKILDEKTQVKNNPVIKEMEQELCGEYLTKTNLLKYADGAMLNYNWAHRLKEMAKKPFGPKHDFSMIERNVLTQIKARIKAGDNMGGMYPASWREYTDLKSIHDHTPMYYRGARPEDTVEVMLFKDNTLVRNVLNALVRDCQEHAIAKAIEDFAEEKHKPST